MKKLIVISIMLLTTANVFAKIQEKKSLDHLYTEIMSLNEYRFQGFDLIRVSDTIILPSLYMEDDTKYIWITNQVKTTSLRLIAESYYSNKSEFLLEEIPKKPGLFYKIMNSLMWIGIIIVIIYLFAGVIGGL